MRQESKLYVFEGYPKPTMEKKQQTMIEIVQQESQEAKKVSRFLQKYRIYSYFTIILSSNEVISLNQSEKINYLKYEFCHPWKLLMCNGYTL